ncbi:MAG: response regulator transcription factor [Bacteroidales bacterium]|nr:response regulator transcription factor [Bacteroidales bacterium]MBN2698343.1 response regulator transcription factor [Bacteroidales bacterium]
MKTKCVIVDDEPLARELIRGHIQKLENFEIVQECDNAIKAMEALRNNVIDLMFLDIKMPQISGIDFLKTLKHPPRVIITTAYSQYALDGFELDVVDYLMKPITFERFMKAVNRYFTSDKPQNICLENENGFEENAFIYVKENKKIIKIYLKEIHFIEGLNEYIRIHTDNRRVVVKSSLQSIEKKLPSELFIRIHKSYIVSIPRIRAFNTTTVELENARLRIGRNFKNQVFSALHVKSDI